MTRHHGQLSSCPISEKTKDLPLRKLSYGWTDGKTTNKWTDGNESDFIACSQLTLRVQKKNSSSPNHIQHS